MTQAKLTSGDLNGYGGFLGGNDGTMVLEVGPAGAKVTAMAFAADGTPTFIKLPVNPVQSMIRVAVDNGFGSVSSAIRRYTTVITSQGSDITYADSATAGALFTVNTSGVYSVTATASFNGVSTIGASLNAASTSANIVALAAAQILASDTSGGADYIACASWTGYVAAGSLIRPQGLANAAGGTNTNISGFTITRVA